MNAVSEKQGGDDGVVEIEELLDGGENLHDEECEEDDEPWNCGTWFDDISAMEREVIRARYNRYMEAIHPEGLTQEQRKEFQRSRRAHHEAGHAVMAVRATLCLKEFDEYGGGKTKLVWVQLHQEGGPEGEGGYCASRQDRDSAPSIILCGAVAEATFLGVPPEVVLGGIQFQSAWTGHKNDWSDFLQAQDKYLPGTRADHRHCLEYASHQLQAVSSHFRDPRQTAVAPNTTIQEWEDAWIWASVQAVAQALLERGSLSDLAVRRIINKAKRAHQGPLSAEGLKWVEEEKLARRARLSRRV